MTSLRGIAIMLVIWGVHVALTIASVAFAIYLSYFVPNAPASPTGPGILSGLLVLTLIAHTVAIQAQICELIYRGKS